MADDRDLARAIEILRRRPRLAQVLIAVSEMIDGRRNCRVSLDVAWGAVRVFREVQERGIIMPDILPDSPPSNPPKG